MLLGLLNALPGTRRMAKKAIANVREHDLNDVLHYMGLRRLNTTTQVLSGVGLAFGGLILGTALGMLLAPRAGREIRKQLREEGFSGLKSSLSPSQESRLQS